MKFARFLFMGYVLLLGPVAKAQAPVCGDGAVMVRSDVGRAVEIYVEDGVADLVRSGDPATLKVEHTSGHLFVTPLTRDPAQLTIIDARGRSHRIRHVFDQGLDEKVVISDCAEVQDGLEGDNLSMQLMRDLIRGRVPARSTEKKSDALMFDNGSVRIRCQTVYELPRAMGYAMRVENLQPQPVIVPLQQIIFPGLLAIASEKDILARGESSKAYMVVQR